MGYPSTRFDGANGRGAIPDRFYARKGRAEGDNDITWNYYRRGTASVAAIQRETTTSMSARRNVRQSIDAARLSINRVKNNRST